MYFVVEKKNCELARGRNDSRYEQFDIILYWNGQLVWTPALGLYL